VLDVGCGGGRLAKYVAPERYLGVDRDLASLCDAQRQFPLHAFHEEMPTKPAYETIAALAVIEHIADSAAFLTALRKLLKFDPQAAIVLTTPHSRFLWLHAAGARLKLFSADASKEHQVFFDRRSLETLAEKCDLKIVLYRRFMLGANQLVILRRRRI
jgi:2-polyprenyl-3-methyl-5-hydroxy-6-metoxy-1,4-benzoquinol methylase